MEERFKKYVLKDVVIVFDVFWRRFTEVGLWDGRWGMVRDDLKVRVRIFNLYGWFFLGFLFKVLNIV